MPKTLGSKPKKSKLLKNPLPFKSTVLYISTADVAREAPEPGDIKYTYKTKYPFTPTTVFRRTKAYGLAGVTKTLPAAIKLAKKNHDKGWNIGRAKTRDGYVVYISV
mgnify:CR=1 FL=1|jgi:hypothetical protein|tara:strand:+ start:34 stop:354 length:321 start_codon:yes stop_codon:yes gene_type:complete